MKINFPTPALDNLYDALCRNPERYKSQYEASWQELARREDEYEEELESATCECCQLPPDECRFRNKES